MVRMQLAQKAVAGHAHDSAHFDLLLPHVNQPKRSLGVILSKCFKRAQVGVPDTPG